jgi:branched-chain amino acid transport system permease protein
LILPAFVVVTIGGFSSVPGALAAGLLVGVIESLSAYFLGATYQQLAYFVIFILIIIFKPQGLFAKSTKMKGGKK